MSILSKSYMWDLILALESHKTWPYYHEYYNERLQHFHDAMDRLESAEYLLCVKLHLATNICVLFWLLPSRVVTSDHPSAYFDSDTCFMLNALPDIRHHFPGWWLALRVYWFVQPFSGRVWFPERELNPGHGGESMLTTSPQGTKQHNVNITTQTPVLVITGW